MDGPPAQSLGVEPVDPAIMTRPPRAKNARVLTPALIRRVLTSAFMIMVGTLVIYVREMADEATSTGLPGAVDPGHEVHQKVVTRRDTTMTFTCFVLFDMFNALTCRSESKSVLRGQIQLFGNRMFNYAVAASLAGQACVIYLPWFQRIFQTEALGVWDFVLLIGIASSVFWVDEGRKYLQSRGVAVAGYSTSV